MVSKIFSTALKGLTGQIIEVEVSATKGLRAFNIVGLADKAISEAKERVSSAIKSIGLAPPNTAIKRVLVNLAPADLKKEGSHYDLPIALGYLLATEQTKFNPEDKIFLAELALDGRLKPVIGGLSAALLAQEKGFSEIILPKDNAAEAALSQLIKTKPSLKIIGAENLKQVLSHLEGRQIIQPLQLDLGNWPENLSFEIELGWIKGQNHAKRGLEIAAAGGHNIFLQGPPGTGKSLLAKAMVSILPPLGLDEAVELTQIYSLAGLLSSEEPFLRRRPFRAPHHTASEAALIGGGQSAKPGEITLSHRGVLFLDEFPEFHRDVLESLRQPMEDGQITIMRARYHLKFPAKFILVGAANPCPCGHYNNPDHECSCAPSQVAAYRRKLSGPLMDRLDIFCWVPSVKYEELISEKPLESSDQIRERVQQARIIQQERFKKENILINVEMNLEQVKRFCPVDGPSDNLLKKMVDSGKLSARGFHRVLKTARTIADIEAREKISFDDISEALMYRLREDK